LNLEFHKTIFELAGNHKLLIMYQNCIQELHLFRRNALIMSDRMVHSNVEHREIFDAIRLGQGRKASRLMEAHVLAAKKRVLKQ
jgi:DNA-binding GntR family transcriptional regulator